MTYLIPCNSFILISLIVIFLFGLLFLSIAYFDYHKMKSDWIQTTRTIEEIDKDNPL